MTEDRDTGVRPDPDYWKARALAAENQVRIRDAAEPVPPLAATDLDDPESPWFDDSRWVAAEPVPLTLDARRFAEIMRETQYNHHEEAEYDNAGDFDEWAIDLLAALARPEPSVQEDRG